MYSCTNDVSDARLATGEETTEIIFTSSSMFRAFDQHYEGRGLDSYLGPTN